MIKSFLADHNISIYKLSKSSGVPYSTLNDLINYKLPVENIRAGQLKSIADILNLSMSELYDLCVFRKSIVSKRYDIRANVVIEHKYYYLQFTYSGRDYKCEILPVKSESSQYIDVLSEWKLNEELGKLKLEEAYESLYS